MLKDILTQKRCFKLVCGAGNEDASEVEKLVALYAAAGANLFDLSANSEVIDAAKRGLERVIPKNELKNYYICVSVGIKGDPHVRKAQINEDKCIFCGKCIDFCPQNAINKASDFIEVNKKRCIGCGKCEKDCDESAISFFSENKSLEEVLPSLVSKGIDCIELHALGIDEQEVDDKWKVINDNFDGLLSICIDRSKLGNEAILTRINRLLSKRKGFTTIIQADGAPMSGAEDNYIATLQSVAMAEIFQNAGIEAFIMLSGGTNSKTSELAKLCAIDINGVAVGSFARKIVREYIDRDDFLENQEVFNLALEKAKKLVDTTFKYMG